MVGNHRIESLLAVDRDGALAFTVFSHFHLVVFFSESHGDVGFSGFFVHLSLHVPYLAVIYSIVSEEGDVPVACRLIAPI